MNIETRKLNLINWISTIQEVSILDKMENIQSLNNDWWNSISEDDKFAINDGINQLNRGDFISHIDVRRKMNEKFNRLQIITAQ